MKDSEMLGIVKKVRQIARREKVSIDVRFRYNSDSLGVDITSSDSLSKKGQRLLETVLHIRPKTQREGYTPNALMKNGSRINKDGEKLELWLFGTTICKIIGTKKEIRQVRKVVEPEKVVIVEEEVEVPIYRCPKGTVLE